MATGTSGDERDDELTDATSEAVDAETTDDAEAAADEAEVDEVAAKDSEAEDSDESKGDSSKAVTTAAAGAAAAKTVVKDKREKQGKTAKRSEAEAAAKKKNEKNGLARFFSEVIAEVKKVVTPTRKELWRYVLVVVAFLIIVMALVALFDFVFNYLASWAFGDGMQLFGLSVDQSSDLLPTA
ncbi:preprotein translocase subunit SecE [Gulosibacter chungangensis]|uniref:Protein translocase subunit SecE n=1 Tax=Gulosibacter chungangensis TaxID=979746 RepID=A0A7J5BF37_9MICO|nr:preprotein translocase subunit SecE [Gulosibacter chungangensis]KAB1644876.1 preprotein translocase subunit SecE [Gulosibacter chungangensis]